MSVSGKVFLITGAGTGLGAAAAVYLASKGALVAITGRRADKLAEVEAQIKAAGKGDVLPLVADVTKEEDWERVVKQTVAKFGKIDVLFSNAASGGPTKAFTDTPASEFSSLYDINVVGVILSVKHVAAELAKTKGSIIITSSGLSAMPRGGAPFKEFAAYSATKAAVDALVRGFYAALTAEGISVYGVNPHVYETEMPAGAATSPTLQAVGLDSLQKMAFFFNINGVLGQPIDVALVVESLVAGTSSYVSGDSFAVFPSTTPGEPFTLGMGYFYEQIGLRTPPPAFAMDKAPVADRNGVVLPPSALAAAQAEFKAHAEKIAAIQAAAHAAKN